MWIPFRQTLNSKPLSRKTSPTSGGIRGLGFRAPSLLELLQFGRNRKTAVLSTGYRFIFVWSRLVWPGPGGPVRVPVARSRWPGPGARSRWPGPVPRPLFLPWPGGPVPVPVLAVCPAQVWFWWPGGPVPVPVPAPVCFDGGGGHGPGPGPGGPVPVPVARSRWPGPGGPVPVARSRWPGSQSQ